MSVTLTMSVSWKTISGIPTTQHSGSPTPMNTPPPLLFAKAAIARIIGSIRRGSNCTLHSCSDVSPSPRYQLPSARRTNLACARAASVDSRCSPASITTATSAGANRFPRAFRAGRGDVPLTWHRPSGADLRVYRGLCAAFALISPARYMPYSVFLNVSEGCASCHH